MTVEGLRHEIDARGIVHVIFERTDGKPNVLTPDILESLSLLLDEWRRRDDARALLIRAGGPGVFIAGMDVDEIADIDEAFKAAEGARFGQAVFQKIADLGKPSLAAISGSCMGGGTEMALACTYRLASDDESLRIALPEVQIGIIPGFGGTQRLPRLLGLLPSLDLILSGRRLDGRRARKLGLVDDVVPAEYLRRTAVRWLAEAAEGKRRPKPRRRPLWAKAVENVPPLRRWAINQARKKTAARVSPEDYPAPFRALEAIEAAFTMPLAQGLDLEARILGEMVPTRTSKSLIWLFKTQTAMKKDGGGLQAPPRKVRRSAVLGAGVMGGGISQLVASRGVTVRLKDIDYEAVLSALQTASGLWGKQLKRRRLSRGEAYRQMGNIAPTLDYSGLRHVDLVIEAVVERLDIKQQVLSDVEQRIGERAVFASNTSSLPITDIAAKALRPERVVGMHFFNPVHRMPLVEVIAGQKSSQEALATVYALSVKLGKTPVIVRDTPGFLVNRILMSYLNEALHLLHEGVSVEDADQAMTSFGMPMGPFTLLDQIGLDTANHVAGVLQEAFGQRLGAGSPMLQTMVEAGKLGVKNGRGFYRYVDGKRQQVEKGIGNLAQVQEQRELPMETLQERMVLAMVNESATCLEDAVVREPREIDIAMVMGTGFPPFRGGLLRHADEVGVPLVVDRLTRLADAQSERFRPARLLTEMVRTQSRFYP